MSDFQGLMMETEGSDDGQKVKHRNSIMKQRIRLVWFCRNRLEMYFDHERFSGSDDAAGSFSHVNRKCISSSFIWKYFSVNSNLVPTFDAGSGTVIDFVSNHAPDSNSDPTLGFDPSPPVLVLDSVVLVLVLVPLSVPIPLRVQVVRSQNNK
ncbi:hypothetical protein EVAR_63398_1 [Eumeta japonica]|uniref:Uncharacterized protein n=1 Tax=Eumeta variegata TaxID=151549 RepID=A0A4C1Z225_EUMVA|nr:hypothetical protein EVAR_63398_1 [Eumeta japonica]